MKKFRILSVLAGVLAFGLVLSSCAGMNAWLREGGGLVIKGLEAYEGDFITATGKAGGMTYTAGTPGRDGVKISNGQARLTVYSDGDIPFEGDAQVDFDVVITQRAAADSEKYATGNAVADLRAGSAIGTATNIRDLGKRPAAPVPAAPAGNLGLILSGLSAYDGNYVIATGKAGGTSLTASSSTIDGVKISGGKATLLVLDGTRAYTGDASVTFDVVIIADESVKSESLGLGSATVQFKGGVGSGTVVGIVDVRSAVSTPAPAAPAASAGSFDYRTIANNGIITAVTTAANARNKGEVFISGTTLTTAGGEQKVLNTTRDAALIAIAADDSSDVGRGRVSGWSKVLTLKVDGSNVIQEITVVPATSAASQLTVGILNNFLKSAKIVSIPGEKNGAHLLTPTQAQNPTITIPRGTTLNLLAPASGTSSVIKFGGWLTLAVEGTVTGENNNAKLGLSPGTGTVTLKKGSKTGTGAKGDWTASAFMSQVNGL